ncbi:MAG TPA: thioredoxin domain-containing protein [Thermoleophilaceae bacterium]
MSSRADQGEQQRAEGEQAAATRDQRVRRLWLFGGSTVVALVVVAIAIALSQSGSSDSDGKGLGGGDDLSGVASTAALFKGIPQTGTLVGDPQAPLRMLEFADLQCPFCAQYTREVLPTLVKRYVRTGQLSIDLRLLTFIGSDSQVAAGAAIAASRENRIWQFSDLFYKNQGQENSGYVTPDFLRSIASGSGVSPEAAVTGSQEDVDAPQLVRTNREATTAGINSTPSFLLGKRGGTLTKLEISQLTPDEFISAIDKLAN